MTQCQSVSDRYGVQCVQGMHHKTYDLHRWMGTVEGEENTLVVWSDDESRDHMDHEREFFALAKSMTEHHYPPVQYQTMIADLLIRLARKDTRT